MGTAVLRSHDCLKGRLHLEAFGSRPPPPVKPSRKKPPRSSPSPSTSPPPPPPKDGRSHQTRPAQPSPPPQPTNHTRPNPPRSVRKTGFPGKENAGDTQIRPRRPLVMEEVTILKRGDELKAFGPPAEDRRSDGDESLLCSTNRLGPDPEILPKKIGFADLGSVYAGPAFFASPSPSSLPFPASFLKKVGGEAITSDEATRSLRCLLRLDNLA
ncbi:ras-associated and pleckstrin homology domains-containing protein 1-like [Phoenix dactylifera]|uniref:Ras-associated and pleckstrin homology domains-containing protein 1-like n=1 Tax=Phoenix dactylifera TaxID=42345 RepID=A0A8B7BT00_PHODC|nr:ras-associated and pleckstrin homology domains-containing protein 1-like [Phoenix dactylifera]